MRRVPAGSASPPPGGRRFPLCIGPWIGILMIVLMVGGCAPGGAGPPQEGGSTACAACEPQAPEPLVFGVDRCDYCGEVIQDIRFGAELLTTEGTVYRFMSTECLAGFILEGRVPDDQIAGIWVVDFSHGRRLLNARKAHFVHSRNHASPNGLNLLALADDRLAFNVQFAWGGDLLDWDGVLELVGESWPGE